MDKELYNRKNKLRKAILIQDIENILDSDYKLSFKFFINEIKMRRIEWDIDNEGNEKPLNVLILVIDKLLKNRKYSYFPLSEIHANKIKRILREYKIKELINET